MIQAREDFDNGSDAKRPKVEDWVDGRTEGEMSFELCCQLLELDPDYTRNRIWPPARRPRFPPKEQHQKSKPKPAPRRGAAPR